MEQPRLSIIPPAKTTLRWAPLRSIATLPAATPPWVPTRFLTTPLAAPSTVSKRSMSVLTWLLVGRRWKTTPLPAPTPRSVFRRSIVLPPDRRASNSLVFALPSVFKHLEVPPADSATADLLIGHSRTTRTAPPTRPLEFSRSKKTLPVTTTPPWV